MPEAKRFTFDGSSTSLILKTATVEDAERLVVAMDAPSSQNLAFFKTPVTLERQRAYLATLEASNQDQLFLIEKYTGDRKLLGTIGLHEYDHNNKNARLGMLIFRREDRGKGYSREAIRIIHRYAFTTHLGLHKLYIRVLLSNAVGLARYRRIGYRVEGVLREEYHVGDGVFEDMFCLSLLHREWSEREGGTP